MTAQPTITHCPSPYGAPMGRADWREAPTAPVRLFRVVIDNGGYDRGGAYWGLGRPIYCATDCEGFRVFTRARDRAEAQRTVAADNPGVVFARPEPPAALYWFTSSCGRVEFQMTMAQAESVSHSGDCGADVDALTPALADTLAAIDADDLRRELREYGAWDDTELRDHAANLRRIVWIAGCDITENPDEARA